MIFDGEIVALDDKGFPRFEWLMNHGRQRGVIVYFVFDLLMLDGRDLRQEPLLERKVRLASLLTKKHPRLIYVDHLEDCGLRMFAEALAMGLEGVVAKDAKSPYVEGPLTTWHWQKIKNKDYKRQEKVEFRQSRKV